MQSVPFVSRTLAGAEGGIFSAFDVACFATDPGGSVPPTGPQLTSRAASMISHEIALTLPMLAPGDSGERLRRLMVGQSPRRTAPHADCRECMRSVPPAGTPNKSPRCVRVLSSPSLRRCELRAWRPDVSCIPGPSSVHFAAMFHGNTAAKCLLGVGLGRDWLAGTTGRASGFR